jgi:DNA polymerase III subunit delta'
MSFRLLVGNERIKNLLGRAVVENRIGQSLLFAGPRGVGKFQFALALAQALNCEHPMDGDACQQCVACRRIASGEHLDVQVFRPEGLFIKVERMRELAREAQFRPYEGRRRVCIIDDAERMNPASANSILKTLEEPPDSSLLILVTSKPYQLLETIRSRCQMVNFSTLTQDELEAVVRERVDLTDPEIRVLARLAQGSIGRALEIDLAGYDQRRSTMIELIESMAVERDSIRLLSAAEYLGKKLEKEEFEQHIETLLVLLNDVFYLRLGKSPESLTNADKAQRLERVAEVVTIEQITGWVDQLEKLLVDLQRNISRQLAMEAVLITN